MNKKSNKQTLWNSLSILLVLGINLMIFSIPISACNLPNEFKEKAVWKDSNGQRYLEITAKDYYSLGCFEGTELADQILNLKSSIELMIGSYGIPYQSLIEIANLYKPYIPEDYKTEMIGMADKLRLQNITFEDILLQNCFIDIYYGQLVPQMSGVPQPPLEIACTGIASKNKDFTVTIGQNFDFSKFLHPTLSFVLHEIKGKPKIFSLRMGGMLGLPMGKNSYGVISTVTVIQTMITGSICLPSTSRTRVAFEKSKTAEDFLHYMQDSASPTSFNTIYADKENNLIGTENIPNLSVKEEIDSREYLVRTNTYNSEEFKPYLIDPLYSLNRQNKAEELVASSFSNGILSLYELMKIIQYKDGTDASICRIGSSNPLESQTGAFIACKQAKYFNFGMFGLGNALENSWGIIPV